MKKLIAFVIIFILLSTQITQMVFAYTYISDRQNVMQYYSGIYSLQYSWGTSSTIGGRIIFHTPLIAFTMSVYPDAVIEGETVSFFMDFYPSDPGSSVLPQTKYTLPTSDGKIYLFNWTEIPSNTGYIKFMFQNSESPQTSGEGYVNIHDLIYYDGTVDFAIGLVDTGAIYQAYLNNEEPPGENPNIPGNGGSSGSAWDSADVQEVKSLLQIIIDNLNSLLDEIQGFRSDMNEKLTKTNLMLYNINSILNALLSFLQTILVEIRDCLHEIHILIEEIKQMLIGFFDIVTNFITSYWLNMDDIFAKYFIPTQSKLDEIREVLEEIRDKTPIGVVNDVGDIITGNFEVPPSGETGMQFSIIPGNMFTFDLEDIITTKLTWWQAIRDIIKAIMWFCLAVYLVSVLRPQLKL